MFYDGRLNLPTHKKTLPMHAVMPRASTLIKAALAASAAIATGLLLTQCGQPKATSYGVDVALSLTPAASARLQALSKPVIVDGYYYGQPTEATASKADDAGHINMGENFTATTTAQTVHISGDAIDPAMMDKIKDGSLSVTVRAYLDPTAGMANVLDCSTFDGALKTAQEKPVAISCDLKK